MYYICKGVSFEKKLFEKDGYMDALWAAHDASSQNGFVCSIFDKEGDLLYIANTEEPY